MLGKLERGRDGGVLNDNTQMNISLDSEFLNYKLKGSKVQ